MPWQTLGVINVGNVAAINWQATPISAIDQDLVRVTFLNPSGDWTKVSSRFLIRRRWNVVGDINHLEQATMVYPSPERFVLTMPIIQDYVDAGLAIYKLEIKKLYRNFRAMVKEPIQSILIEVQ